MLDASPEILDLVHADLERALDEFNGESKRRGGFLYTSEMVLRLSLCQTLEGASLRGIVVRADDSNVLRRFTRIFEGPMMGHSALCRLRNAILPETWKSINALLSQAAVKAGAITSERIRLDTTAVETNVHWPTDSSLLWDSYRKLSALIEVARQLDVCVVGPRRLQVRRAKKLAALIARKAQGKGKKAKDLKPLYIQLIGLIEAICTWATDVARSFEVSSGTANVASAEKRCIAEKLKHFVALATRVVWQASERVVHGREVPNDQKLFSIFEPHTELLIRGKAGKDVEFGHMIQIQQTGEKFITEYDAFDRRPIEPELVAVALKRHVELFGELPDVIAADKGYWSRDAFAGVPEGVTTVAIPKKGGLNEIEYQREHDPLFRLAQHFRAGVEGSISFLKRVLYLGRCMRKGWLHYSAAVGATVFAHNLLILARC